MKFIDTIYLKKKKKKEIYGYHLPSQFTLLMIALFYILSSDTEKCSKLEWKLRLSITNGIAKGLLYLHKDCRLRVIHRNLKASNINATTAFSGPTITDMNNKIDQANTNMTNAKNELNSLITSKINALSNQLNSSIQSSRPTCNWNGKRGIWGDHGAEDDYWMYCDGGKLTGIHAMRP